MSVTGHSFLPLGYLLEGLGEGAEDNIGAAIAEAFDGLVGVIGSIPEADADAVGGQVCADPLTDGTSVREGKGRQGGDEDHGVGLFGKGVEKLVGQGFGGEQEGGVIGSLHELGKHEGGELVGLIAGGDADDGELLGSRSRSCRRVKGCADTGAIACGSIGR